MDTQEQTVADERVARGMALLDEREPGWRDRVDWSRMRITSTMECVLGQVYGSFWSGMRQLGFVTPDGEWIEDEDGTDAVVAHGFTCNGGSWDELQDAWLRAVGADTD